METHLKNNENMPDFQKKSADANVDVQVAASGEFPRVMLVSNTGGEWFERVVVIANNTGCIAYSEIASLDEISDDKSFVLWDLAKEISPKVPEVLEVTIEEIAERFGVSSDQIRVKV